MTDVAIRTEQLGKCYRLFDRPQDRLKQALWPRGPRRYREFWALRNLDLEVQRGETVGIVGRNGSGKSTLLQLICRTVQPTEGEVQVRGRIAALLELGAGFNLELSGHDNVFLNGSLLGLTMPEIEARYDAILAFADIGDFIRQPIKTYSSGMVVRLAFAIAAHVDAEILVIDEALAVGDAFFTQKCMRYLRAFRERGTLLFVSHDMGSVVNLCERAVLLERGEALAIGPAKTVCERYLQHLYDELKPHAVKPPAADADLIEATEPAPFADASAFGAGGARIHSVQLLDEAERPLSLIQGGEAVKLRIVADGMAALFNPMLGFLLKDRLGQYLFGDNTYAATLGRPLMTEARDRLLAEFHFRMPQLANGEYIIAAAIAEGTQSDHVQHHWVHDALAIKVEAREGAQGLFQVPMQRVTLSLLPRAR
jgi:lipopolysaccharide transport system ATP-binding protein